MVAPFPDGRIARSMVRIPGSGSSEDARLACLNLGTVSSFAGIVQVPQNLSLTMRNGRQQMMSSLSLGATKQKPESTSLLNDDGTNSEEKVDSSASTLANEGASRATRVDAIASVLNINSNQSSAGRGTTPSTVANGSRQKRPFRQESAEEPAVVPKRYKAMAATSSNLAVPSGTMGTTGSLSLPLLLPVVTSSGTTMAVPTAHCNNGQPSFFLPEVMSQANTQHPAVLVPGQFPIVEPRGVQQMVQERDQLMKENISLKRRLSLFHHLLRNKEKLSRVLRHLEAIRS